MLSSDSLKSTSVNGTIKNNLAQNKKKKEERKQMKDDVIECIQLKCCV